MTFEKINELSEDFVVCWITGTSVNQMIEIAGKIPHYTAHSLRPEEGEGYLLRMQKAVFTESEFEQEHEKLVACVHGVESTAQITTRYFPAGEGVPKYERRSHVV
jgi:hypothetical protein